MRTSDLFSPTHPLEHPKTTCSHLSVRRKTSSPTEPSADATPTPTLVRQSIFINRTFRRKAAFDGTPKCLQHRTRCYLHASHCRCVDRSRDDARLAIDRVVEAVGTHLGNWTGRRNARNHRLSNTCSHWCTSVCSAGRNSAHMAGGRRRDRFHALRCIDPGYSINLLLQPRILQAAGNHDMHGRTACAVFEVESLSSVPRDVYRSVAWSHTSTP